MEKYESFASSKKVTDKQELDSRCLKVRSALQSFADEMVELFLLVSETHVVWSSVIPRSSLEVSK